MGTTQLDRALRNVVGSSLKINSFVRAGSIWFWERAETSVNLNFQKSRYENHLWMNVGLEVRTDRIASPRRPEECAVYCRADNLQHALEDREIVSDTFERLLDLDDPISELERKARLRQLIETLFLPAIRRVSEPNYLDSPMAARFLQGCF